MTSRSKLFAALVGAGLAAAGSAFAREVIETTTYYYVPATDDTRTYYYVTEGPGYVARVPATDVVYTEPAITVEAPRLTEDQRITHDVVDVLARDPYLSGRIGVETHDRDVTLSGSVTTPGQVRRAVRDARGVPGVGHVTSELRPKVALNTSY